MAVGFEGSKGILHDSQKKEVTLNRERNFRKQFFLRRKEKSPGRILLRELKSFLRE